MTELMFLKGLCFACFCYLHGYHYLRYLVLFQKQIIVKLKSRFEFQILNQNLCLENQNQDSYCRNELDNRNRKTSGKIQIQNFSSKIQI